MADAAAPRERGAILLETACVSMLLMVLAATTIEYASFFSSTNGTAQAVRTAARAGSITNSSGTVTDDWQIIQALTDGGGSPKSDINWVAIYRADSATSVPPAQCLTMTLNLPGGAKCDVYDSAQFTLSESQLEALPSSQRQWPESKRVAGTDYIGVWVQVSRPRAFNNMIPSPDSYTDHFTMQIAPVPTVSTASGWAPKGTFPPGWLNDTPNWPESWLCEGNGTNCEADNPGGVVVHSGGTSDGT